MAGRANIGKRGVVQLATRVQMKQRDAVGVYSVLHAVGEQDGIRFFHDDFFNDHTEIIQKSREKCNPFPAFVPIRAKNPFKKNIKPLKHFLDP